MMVEKLGMKPLVTNQTHCTQLPDRECKEDDCCLRVCNIPKETYDKMHEMMDKRNWSISCEK